MVSVDSELLFDAAAAAITVVAVLVFAFNVDLGGSPLAEQALLVAFLAGVFAVTQRSGDRRRVVAGYAVVVVGALALVVDAVTAFSLGPTATVLALLALAGALFGLRGRLGADGTLVSGRTATRALVALAVLAAAVLLVDVVTGGLAYELRLQETVELRGEDVAGGAAGTLLAANPTPLPEPVDAPRYRACAAGNWSAYELGGEEERPGDRVRADADVGGAYDDQVDPFDRRRYPVEIRVIGVSMDGVAVPVEVAAECPEADDDGDPYVVVFAVDGDPRPTPI